MSGLFESIDRGADRLGGRSGLIVQDETGSVLYERQADVLFPAASVIKLALVMVVHAEAAAGRISLDRRLAIPEAVPGSGVLRLLGGIDALPVADLAMLTVAVSDNVAANLLIDHLGVDRIGARLREWGIRTSRIERRLFDLEARARGRDNLMTPRETAALLLRLLGGGCVDRATSEVVLGLLRECQDHSMLQRYLPAGVGLAHKSGWLDDVCNDAGIVFGPRPVIAVGFCAEIVPSEAIPLLGLLGWSAYRAAGGVGPALPPEVSGRA